MVKDYVVIYRYELRNLSPDVKSIRDLCSFTRFFFAETRLDIAFIVSNCGKNSGDSFHQQLDLARNFILLLSVDRQNLRTAIISVSDGFKIIQDLKVPTSNSTVVSLESPSSGGLCTFGRGLEATGKMFKTKGMMGIPQLVIVLLAGKSSDDVSKPANDLHKAGVLVYSVGLKKTINASTVINLPSDPVAEYFLSFPDFAAVDSTKQALLDKLNRGFLNKFILFKNQILQFLCL